MVVRAINWLVYQSGPWAKWVLWPRRRVWLAAPRWLSRLSDRLYFGAALHRCVHRRQPTTRRRMNAQYEPSRRLMCVVVLLWSLVLVLIAHLVVIVLHGPIVP